MEQLFITPAGKLEERWRQAFPQAAALSDVNELAQATAGRRGVLWLDARALPVESRTGHIGDVVATGWPVVVMVAKPEEAEAFRLLNAGAVGYCHLLAASEQLREVALAVQNGGLWMPPELLQRLLSLSLRVVPPDPPRRPELNALTSRELMVAEQVAHGASNREIAAALDITERTVKAHLSAIFEKMGVRDRVQLALAMNNIPTYSTVN